MPNINLKDYYPGFEDSDFGQITIDPNIIVGDADTDFLRMYGAAMVQFRDASQKIYSSASSTLDIAGATTNIAASTLGAIYSPDIRLGYDSGAYMKIAVTDTTGVTAVTFGGSGATLSTTVATASFTTSTLTGVYAPDIRMGISSSIYMKIAQTATTGVMAVTFVGGSGVTYTLTAPTITFVGSSGIKLDGTVTLDDDGTIADASNVTTITQNTITLAGSTAINLDGPTTVTGILTIDTAGSPADGILINATTPTDGLQISSACGSHAINISAAQTGAGITIASTCGTYGLHIVGACTTAGILLAGVSADGLLISGSCTTAAINITGANLNCFKSVFNIGAQLGQYVQGIKMEHTRSADIQPSTGGWWGMQVVLNAGTGYTALDKTAYVIHAVFKGDATSAATGTCNVIRAETQSNGKVEDLLFVSANDGSTVEGDVARFVAHVAPTRAILGLQNGTAGSTPAALYIDVNETMTTGIVFDTGAAITNLLRVTAATNTSYFLLADAEAGCFPNYSSAGSAIANIKIKIGTNDGYIKVYDAA